MSANVEETEMTTQTDAANSGQTVLVHAEIGADGALRPVVAELLGAAQTDPELAAAFRRTYSGPRRAVGRAALRRAQERGQVRAT